MNNEAIKRLAYVIYQQRKRNGEIDADDELKNWQLAEEQLNKVTKEYVEDTISTVGV